MLKSKTIKTILISALLGVSLSGCSSEAQNIIADVAGEIAGDIINSKIEEYQNSTTSSNTEATAAGDKDVYISFITESGSAIEIPYYSGHLSVDVNNNQTFFTEDDLVGNEYYTFSSLDGLNRCGEADAIVSINTITNEDRGSIGMIKPSGWQTIRYDDLISDKYLYNRSHLIMFAMIGNDSNVKENLITGTRAFNADTDEGMLHYENIVLNYIKENAEDKVRYRVTPIFIDDELVARGVLMEAKSINTDNLEFCTFVYNIQPGIGIDYSTGDSWVAEE